MPSKQNQPALQIPEIIRNFEVCLRSGYSLSQAFEIVGQDLGGPTGQQTHRVYEELNNGTPLDAALDNWLARCPQPDLDLFVATIKVQREVGGNLADKLRLLGQIMARRTIV